MNNKSKIFAVERVINECKKKKEKRKNLAGFERGTDIGRDHDTGNADGLDTPPTPEVASQAATSSATSGGAATGAVGRAAAAAFI